MAASTGVTVTAMGWRIEPCRFPHVSGAMDCWLITDPSGHVPLHIRNIVEARAMAHAADELVLQITEAGR